MILLYKTLANKATCIYVLFILSAYSMFAQGLDFKPIEYWNRLERLKNANIKGWESEIKSLRDLPNQEKSVLCLLGLQESQVLYFNGRESESEKLFNQHFEQLKLLNMVELQAYAIRAKGETAYLMARYRLAGISFRDALNIAKKNNQEELIDFLNYDIAKIFDKLSNSQEALRFYHRAFRTHAMLNQSEASMQAALALGKIYLQNNQLDSAELYLHHAVQIATIRKDSNHVYNALIEKTNVYAKQKKFDSANDNLLKIQKLSPHVKDIQSEVRLLVLRGNILMHQGYVDSAKQIYKEALSFPTKDVGIYTKYYIHSNIADAYFDIGQHEQAYSILKGQSNLKSAISVDFNTSYPAEVLKDSEVDLRDKEITFLQIQNQLRQKQIENGLLLKKALLRENEIKDITIKKEQLLQDAARIENENNTAALLHQQELNQNLEAQNVLKQKTIAEERKTKQLLWLGLAMLTGLGLLIYYLYKKQLEKNAIIQKQTQELEAMNKEVHHRVKNNLQVVSSLLDLQADHTKDPLISQIIKESKQRVQSMAFIHQNLYEGEAVHEVHILNYLQMMADHLQASYLGSKRNISIAVSGDALLVQMDTAISIGMIVNELVTNAFKYAFENRSSGRITINIKKGIDDLLLTVEDDGVGMSEDFDHTQSKSFGYKIIRAFAQKLKANILISNVGGTKVELLIKKFKAA